MSADRRFVHLHCHSEYSFLQSCIPVKKLVKLAAADGMPAVALTDQANTFGAVQFYKYAKEAGIRPVIGAEVYLAPGGMRERTGKARDLKHLTLLVMNDTGYRNLCHLITQGYFHGFYHKARIDKELLAQHHEGLICLSSSGRGEVATLLAGGYRKEAAEAARWYRDVFVPGEDGQPRFYLEIQDMGWEGERSVMQAIREIAREEGIPLVATNHVHYPKPKDSFVQEVLLCLGSQRTLDDDVRFRFPSDQFYFKSTDEMYDLFPEDHEALENTVRIAERCDFHFNFDDYHFPVYPYLEGRTPQEVLVQLSEEGLEKRLEVIRAQGDWEDEEKWAEERKKYDDRLKIELGIIQQMGFDAYFLIVYDFINWAKDHDIPVGPGRGSGAGSLVLYSLRITDVDPLAYDLLFERFLNPERVSMPDVDVDFCQDRRHEVIDYVGRAYGGRDQVCQIITFGKMLAKGVLRDVGRVMGMSFGEVDKIAKLVPERLGITLKAALVEEDRLAALRADEARVDKLMSLGLRLEGQVRHSGVHAAGVVIADKPLINYSPLLVESKAEEGALGVTQYDMKSAESIGLIKFDFLGLKTLTSMKHSLDMLLEHKRTEWEFKNFSTVPVDDEVVYDLYQAGDTLGVFQVESSGMRELLRKLKPTCFEDIIAVLALYRPGPLGSGMVDVFVECKHGRRKVVYPVPEVEPILKPTYGVIVYQEQVMQIAQVMSGYSLGEADLLRRAMGKKKPEAMAKQKVRFVAGCKEHGYTEEKATEVFDLLAKFAEYGFNKSHTAAYALVSYQTAWLKAHHRAYFMAGLLTIESSNTDKVLAYLQDAREAKLTILPPDVNESQLKFSVVEGNPEAEDEAARKDRVRFGLTAIKGVGDGAIESILAARKELGTFKDIEEFAENIDLRKCNKRVFEALIKCGAFDSLGYKRRELFESLDRVLDAAQRKQKDAAIGQFGLFGGPGGAKKQPIRLATCGEWRERERLENEKSALGFYITGHPMTSYTEAIGRFATHTTQTLHKARSKTDVTLAVILVSVRVMKTRKGDQMAFVVMEDMVGQVEGIIFPKSYLKSREILDRSDPVLVRGTLERGDDGNLKILVDDIRLLSDVTEAQTQMVELHLKPEELNGQSLGQLRDLLKEYPGRCDAVIQVELEGQQARARIALPRDLTVRPAEELTDRIEELYGRPVTQLR